jgi:thioester reductase-like protein
VHSTIEILRLAAININKNIHYISTLSTGLDTDENNFIVEDWVKKYPNGNEGGYTLSKWAAEKILADASKRGFNCTIHRLPQLMGHSKTGASPNDKTHIMMLMKSWIEIGKAPKNMGNFEFLPVDSAADFITHICGNISSLNKVYNYGHSKPISYDTIIGWLNEFGYIIELTDIKQWQLYATSHIKEESALYPLLALYMDAYSDNISEKGSKTGFREDIVVTKNMQESLKREGLRLPELNKELFFRYFIYLQSWFGKQKEVIFN